MKLKKYVIFLIMLNQLIIPITKNSKLFIAIAQGKHQQVKSLLEDGASVNAIRNFDGNTPLMEAIKEIGQALIEIEASSVMGRLSEAGNLTDDFRSFFRKFVVSFLLAYSCSTIRAGFNDNDEGDAAKSQTFLVMKKIINSFFPAIEQAAIMWCIYSFLDYGIAVGRHPKDQDAFFENEQIEQLRKTIKTLLKKHTIDINYTNYSGESALSLIHTYQNKLQHRTCKLVLYQIEQVLLDSNINDT